jgi:hypothetical protein
MPMEATATLCFENLGLFEAKNKDGRNFVHPANSQRHLSQKAMCVKVLIWLNGLNSRHLENILAHGMHCANFPSIMKLHVCTYVLIALASTFLAAPTALAADNTPPDQATPGTPPATDTKTQMNNPGGPTNQATAATPPETKKDTNNTNGTETQATTQGSGAKSSKKHHKHKKTTDSSSDSGTGTNTTPKPQ